MAEGEWVVLGETRCSQHSVFSSLREPAEVTRGSGGQRAGLSAMRIRDAHTSQHGHMSSVPWAAVPHPEEVCCGLCGESSVARITDDRH
eukprot:5069946-Pleurochrysis_carterae.AAC.1